MSSFGLIEENMELPHIHLGVDGGGLRPLICYWSPSPVPIRRCCKTLLSQTSYPYIPRARIFFEISLASTYLKTQLDPAFDELPIIGDLVISHKFGMKGNGAYLK